jgi:hypothetical protein
MASAGTIPRPLPRLFSVGFDLLLAFFWCSFCLIVVVCSRATLVRQAIAAYEPFMVPRWM